MKTYIAPALTDLKVTLVNTLLSDSIHLGGTNEKLSDSNNAAWGKEDEFWGDEDWD